MEKLVIYAADIGSIKNKKFGWARKEMSVEDIIDGTSIELLLEKIIDDLNSGHKIALGFECPLFVPLSENPKELTSARKGEGNRAWSAGPGCGALATGLTETLWVFENLKKKTSVDVVSTFNITDVYEGKANLFIWEAFVSGNAKGSSHHEDATIAVQEFDFRISNEALVSDVTVENPYSLIGAALLRSGIAEDINLLHEQCIVIKA